MVSDILVAARSLVVFTVLTGVIYPLGIYSIGRVAFAGTAGGSLVARNGRVVGSSLLAQKPTSTRYFFPRPSAADYATVASGASNLGPTSVALKEAVAKRQSEFGDGAPPDLLLASGSGLDPHISPAAAKFQIARVASSRALTDSQRFELEALVQRSIEGPQFGLLGQPRVNVLLLNLAMDERFP